MIVSHGTTIRSHGTAGKYASKTQREAAKKLAEMGFEEVGYKEGSHLVMMHPSTGRMEVPKHTPPHILVQTAIRKERLLHNKANRVIDYIQSAVGILPDEQKVVNGNLTRWIEDAQRHLGGDVADTNTNALLESIRKGDRVVVLKRAHQKNGKTTDGVYRMRGLFYLDPEEVLNEESAPAPKGRPGRKVSFSLTKAQDMLNQGKSVREVAKLVGVGYQGIYHHIKNGNLIQPSQGIRVVEEDPNGYHAEQGIHRPGVLHTDIEPERIPEEVKEKYSETRETLKDLVRPQPTAIPHEGLNVLGEYLKAINEMGEAQAKVDLMKDGIADLRDLFADRAIQLGKLAELDLKIVDELDTLRSL